ncbi:hypothetical protein FOC4_g10001472 [Fusarium odoratissimum]|uniref:COX assembly mitochondrial protein n=2 Tax=Fusarium oxysporum species complex TaxID=171631 RepID=N1SA37_FUSC4|nr:hypothetical protein FOC4_g10001472 [Fusarium odoratissimum]TXC11609.1 hypothetical protein FocTR4_00007692 [Fusarium oxysporum f. sp. cubense]
MKLVMPSVEVLWIMPRALVPWPQWPSRTPRCQRRSSESPLATLYLSPHHKKHKSEISSIKKSEKNVPMRSKARTPAFAACALGRTFTVSFACRAEHRSMNSCMKLHATQSAHDEAREEWFALRIERQRERERKARVAQAQEEFMREWWGLPEHVRLSRQKEMEQRGERIHGLTAKDRPRGEGQ